MAAEDQSRRIDLVAPQDGKVFQRSVHTVGGVIQAGEVLMLVVPVSDALIVEARVSPQDVDQLHLGQRAVVRFSSFNRRTTPELNGDVTEIGADATQDEKRNESYYSVRIRIPDSEFERLDGLQPMSGMPVETFIETSPRTVVSYLMRPMLEQIDRTWRGMCRPVCCQQRYQAELLSSNRLIESYFQDITRPRTLVKCALRVLGHVLSNRTGEGDLPSSVPY